MTGNIRYASFVTECAVADVCAEPTITGWGTNLSEEDSDYDGLDDKFEITERDIVVNGDNLSVTSDPLKKNSDEDLWDDYREKLEGTNPRESDTDGDQTSDNDEQEKFRRNPAEADRRVEINYTAIDFYETGCRTNKDENWEYKLLYQTPNDIWIGNTQDSLGWRGYFEEDTDDDGETITKYIDGSPVSFLVNFGESFAITGQLKELVDGGKFLWDEQYNITSSSPFGTYTPTIESGGKDVCGGKITIHVNY